MAKERLSKLQKWILEKCYERKDNQCSFVFRREITGYIGRNNSSEATTSRTIRNLIKKGLVIGIRGRKLFGNKGEFDYATELAIRFHKEGKIKEEYQREIEDLIKRFGKNEKHISFALPGETIQAIQITQQGAEVYALMLTKANILKLNNKEIVSRTGG